MRVTLENSSSIWLLKERHTSCHLFKVLNQNNFIMRRGGVAAILVKLYNISLCNLAKCANVQLLPPHQTYHQIYKLDWVSPFVLTRYHTVVLIWPPHISKAPKLTYGLMLQMFKIRLRYWYSDEKWLWNGDYK